MKILIDKSFQKDTDKITDQKIIKSIFNCILKIQKLDKLTDLANCKKLKNSNTAYRIRIGDYRIGFLFENDSVILIRFLHRSKIYNYFPE
ncbi:MAG: type II toxin-antitoxin system RelE family toxin [Bacteroidia bacterium]